MDDIELSSVPAPWQHVALVCGKCSRKLHGGFGKKGKRDLAGELKAAAKAAGQRRVVRVLEVGCLGLCPKRAVTMVSSARPGEVLVIPAGADAAAVLVRLTGAAASAP